MKKLFIPGPVQVSKQVLQELAKDMMHHRSAECVAIIKEIKNLIAELLQTKNDILLLTNSSTGSMEAGIRSCVANKVLCVANGEFGRRWYDIAISNGKEAKLLDFGDGKEIDYNNIAEELKNDYFDSVTFVINETSTGMENDSKALKAAVQSSSKGTLILADGVSAAFGIKLDLEDYDVLLFGTQKALALPPGMSIIIANEKAFKRSENVKNKGYYLDFIRLKERSDNDMTLTTPALPILYALKYRLQEIKKQGISNYIKNHETMAEFVRKKIQEIGFKPFVPENYSKTLTVISNNLNIDVPKLIKSLAEKDFIIENGYGPLKNKTFRIGHMGDIAIEDTEQLLNEIEKLLADKS
jgi:aspartate aminotransferase-like enzyme